MVHLRSCKSARLTYIEPSSNSDSESSDQEATNASELSNVGLDLSPSPYRRNADRLSRFCSRPSLAKECDELDQKDDLFSMINDFIDYHYSFTGRFDQQDIGVGRPMPDYPCAFEQLGIAATMTAYFEEHPNDIKELDLRNDRSDSRPWRDGVPWSQYENACLVEEMSLHMRTRGESKIGGATLMTKMSHILNYRYGIGRSPMGVKNQWYRTLRARSGIDERGCFRTARNSQRFAGPLAVSQGAGRSKSRAPNGRVHKRKSGPRRKL